jgi:cytoplasmic iron level regulating protein YaaA (DUF328/UPF0246 family)
MRLLILTCGATKRPDPSPLPAIERYDGPPYRTLRKTLRELAQDARPHILILSAQFGLIEADAAIPTYDRRMSATHAVQLRPRVREALQQHLAANCYAETLINLGADYLPALTVNEAVAPHLGLIRYTTGGIGERMQQMKRWLLESITRSAERRSG